ncbi:MAG: S9 family peptidase [Robiginitomaculum sp.]
MIFDTTLAKAPRAQKIKTTIEQVGHTRTDFYAWMKDENWQMVMQDPSILNPKIRIHLKAENAYCQTIMAETKQLQDTILSELKGRIKDNDGSVPTPDGPYVYANRYRSGDQHGLYYRKLRDDPAASEKILLDADALAKHAKKDNHPFFDIHNIGHSDDHKFIAYAVDLKGSERFEIHVIHIQTGKEICPPIKDTAGSFVWAKDSATLFWVARDENNRPSKVYRQNIMQKTEDPLLIYEEENPGFFVDIGRSDSGDYIEINCNDHTSSETRLIAADKPTNDPLCFKPRAKNVEYSLHDHGKKFYILTNENGATDFKIMQAAQTDPDPWQDFIPHKPGVLIIGMETYKNFLVRLERKNALPRIIIRNMQTGKEHTIEFDEAAYALGLMSGYEYDTPWLRFSYSSPTTPQQVFDYHMATGEKILRKSSEIPSGHEPSDYKVERITIKAKDGEMVPVTLIMQAGFNKNGKAPCLLYGYGSYGITISASFRSSILSLIDRGFIYAIAHIRGGMAKGYNWYTKGKLEKKQATFDDFIDVGTALCAQNYTKEGKIIAHGGSAGGLLVGVALNQAPSLFGGVIAAVPFVDVLNTMSDESLPLTPPEWPEWGNPLKDKGAYDTIAAYSPYDNVTGRNYPPVLITAGLTDPRVTYWEPAKWTAKLRDHQKGQAPILLKINMDAGHQGEAGRYDSLKQVAFEYAFALKAAGKV